MKELLRQIYYVVDEALPVAERDNRSLETLRAALSDEQLALLDHYVDEQTDCEDLAREQLFYLTLRMGLAISAVDIRRP